MQCTEKKQCSAPKRKGNTMGISDKINNAAADISDNIKDGFTKK
ncbi:hypothetical protein [Arthrobacter sp. Rue61a]|nr:hypothetical protein [Arthrobacter sp. Rue61a]